MDTGWPLAESESQGQTHPAWMKSVTSRSSLCLREITIQTENPCSPLVSANQGSTFSSPSRWLFIPTNTQNRFSVLMRYLDFDCCILPWLSRCSVDRDSLQHRHNLNEYKKFVVWKFSTIQGAVKVPALHGWSSPPWIYCHATWSLQCSEIARKNRTSGQWTTHGSIPQ